MSISQHRLPAAVLLAATLSACSHHPTISAAPLPAKPAAVDSTALLAARRAHEDSLRAAREAAARRATEDSLLAARTAAARLEDLDRTLTAPLFFDFDKSDLRAASVAALDAKTPLLEDSPSLHIQVAGNADERGSEEYNLALGMRRAAAAKRFLTLHGVDSTQIDIVSYGKERPVCSEHTESCWQQNRRDGFSIVSGQPHIPAATT